MMLLTPELNWHLDRSPDQNNIPVTPLIPIPSSAQWVSFFLVMPRKTLRDPVTRSVAWIREAKMQQQLRHAELEK